MQPLEPLTYITWQGLCHWLPQEKEEKKKRGTASVARKGEVETN